MKQFAAITLLVVLTSGCAEQTGDEPTYLAGPTVLTKEQVGLHNDP